MKNYLQEKMFELANILELMIAIICVLAISILAFNLIGDSLTMVYSEVDSDVFTEFLESALTLVIGIEFVKMLCKHTPSTVIEVLLFAIARQLIVGHVSVGSGFIGVLSIAVLFGTRKFLFCNFDETEKTIYPAKQKVKLVNALAHVDIPLGKGETLAEVIEEELLKTEEAICVGSCVYYHGFALRVEHMKNGRIHRVELIKSLY